MNFPRLTVLATFLLFSIICGMGEASALSIQTNASGETVVVDEAGRYWYWDLDYFADLDYYQQLDLIAGFNSEEYFDQDQWHLATFDEITDLGSNTIAEIADSFNRSYEQSWRIYWYGRIDEEFIWPSNGELMHYYVGLNSYYGNDPSSAWSLGSLIATGTNTFSIGAWVVSSPTPTPEPSTIFLLGTGLASLAASRRRKK